MVFGYDGLLCEASPQMSLTSALMPEIRRGESASERTSGRGSFWWSTGRTGGHPLKYLVKLWFWFTGFPMLSHVVVFPGSFSAETRDYLSRSGQSPRMKDELALVTYSLSCKLQWGCDEDDMRSFLIIEQLCFRCHYWRVQNCISKSGSNQTCAMSAAYQMWSLQWSVTRKGLKCCCLSTAGIESVKWYCNS